MLDRSLVESLLTALSARTQAETLILTARLRESCWPGGEDRTEPAACEWVRRWGPGGLPPLRLSCSCPGGRCAVCN
jgi:hypothetical protein